MIKLEVHNYVNKYFIPQSRRLYQRVRGLIFILLIVSCNKIDTNSNIVTIINSHRQVGVICNNIKYDAVPKIISDIDLDIVAAYHSQYMSDNDTMCHTWHDGTTMTARFHILKYNSTFKAENIAYNHSDVISVMETWINSPCHCANIMDKRATKVGFSCINGYYTLVLSN